MQDVIVYGDLALLIFPFLASIRLEVIEEGRGGRGRQGSHVLPVLPVLCSPGRGSHKAAGPVTPRLPPLG